MSGAEVLWWVEQRISCLFCSQAVRGGHRSLRQLSVVQAGGGDGGGRVPDGDAAAHPHPSPARLPHHPRQPGECGREGSKSVLTLSYFTSPNFSTPYQTETHASLLRLSLTLPYLTLPNFTIPYPTERTLSHPSCTLPTSPTCLVSAAGKEASLS